MLVVGHLWLTPAILATLEAEIRRIVVQSQPGQILARSYLKKNHHKRAGGVAQGVGLEFKSPVPQKNVGVIVILV
jgi:hypothetical protein